MLKNVVDLGIPAGIFVLMLIAGTEMAVRDFVLLVKHPKPVLIGAFGQLVVLPPLSFLVAAASAVIRPLLFLPSPLLPANRPLEN
jgi:predicted Na+-dependent transporter